MKKISSGSWLLALPVVALDILFLDLAVLSGYMLWLHFPWHGNYQPFAEYAILLWLMPPVMLLTFRYIGLYKPEMGVLGVEEQSLLFKGIWILYVLVLALSFFYRGFQFSRLATFYSAFFAVFYMSIGRFFARRWYEALHRQGIGVRKALIYGAGYHGQRLSRWIAQLPKLGIKVAGYLDDDPARLTKKPDDRRLYGGVEDLRRVAKSRKAQIVFIAHRRLPEERVMEIFQICRDMEITCWAIPSVYAFHIERAQWTNIGGIPLVGFRQFYSRKYYEGIKHLLDFALSLFLSAFLFIPGLLIAAGILLTSPGTVFFRQSRVGKDGKKFTIYKFRSMHAGSIDDVSPELKKGEKSQITSFGAFLRSTGFDEIPQLLNVLRGEMSLIGPRPEMPFIVENYGPLERERLSVRPGITGLWQISDDRKRIFIHENMDYDLYYLEHFGFNLDLAIFFKTVYLVIGRVLGLRPKGKSGSFV